VTDRRRFLASASALAVGAALPASAALPPPLDVHRLGPGAPPDGPRADLTVDQLEAAEAVQGLSFSAEDRALMLDDVAERLESLAAIRAAEPPNSVPPALTLDLTLGGDERPGPGPGAEVPMPRVSGRPASDRDLAFASIPALGALLRSGAVTSVELTELSLRRLREFDPTLQAVVSTVEDRALETARARDRELAAGVDRGPLHGIPYGAKDLLAARGAPTTWGAEPYRDQEIDEDALVVRRLEQAGAVLVAKLTLGALAWGDVWFGGTTKNPWNPDQGASGSSAGPGAAVAAGLVPFAIGSETLGSIVSPSTRNGVTGLRPTFGRVPTDGAMALSWSMDKLGPMTRSAVDAALVFDAIRGPVSGEDAAFPFRPDTPLSSLRVGTIVPDDGDDEGAEADRATIAVLRRLGVSPVRVELPDDLPVDALRLILEAEAAAAFDGLTRSRGTDRLVRQERYAWPNVFRHARHIPAVEYINANRIRTQLMRAMADLMSRLDVLVTPSFGNAGLLITNLTGHPAVAIPNGLFPVEGSDDRRQPHSVTFLSPLWGEHHALRLAHAVQEATDWHRQRPPVS
jgi:Asp-tRNA(Asn)/Glu-tRNA(Gln) amidotransferase A subunit family amidase